MRDERNPSETRTRFDAEPWAAFAKRSKSGPPIDLRVPGIGRDENAHGSFSRHMSRLQIAAPPSAISAAVSLRGHAPVI